MDSEIRAIQLTIVGHDLPGTVCGPSRNVHVDPPAIVWRVDAT